METSILDRGGTRASAAALLQVSNSLKRLGFQNITLTLPEAESFLGLYFTLIPKYLSSLNRLSVGPPACERQQQQLWSIYAYAGSSDRLTLLTSGKLRHYARDKNYMVCLKFATK